MRKILFACSAPEVISRGSFSRSLLEISEFVRDLRESLLGFIQALIDSVHHSSEGRGLINTRSGTGGLRAASGGALHRFRLVCLLAGGNQPYHHTISHALFLLCWAFLCEILTIARIAPLLGALVNRGRPSAVSKDRGPAADLLQPEAERTRNSLRNSA